MVENYTLKKIVRFASSIQKRNPSQLFSLADHLVNAMKGSDKPSAPLFSIIGINSECNLNCKLCLRRTKTIQNIIYGKMSFERYKKIIDSLYMLQMVMPIGWGEPLLHRDLYRMVEYTKKKGIEVVLISNGTLMDESAAEKLVHSGTDRIYVSLDGVTNAVIKDTRPGIELARIVKNIKNLKTSIKKHKAQTKIGLCTVLTKKNFEELPQLVRLAGALNLSEVYTQDIEINNNPEIAIRNLNAGQKERVRESFDKAIEEAKSLGIILRLPRIEQSKRLNNCTIPWQGMVISPRGLVTPCDSIFDMQFGNVFEQDPLEIWQNESFVKWRKAMKSSSPSERCLKCASF